MLFFLTMAVRVAEAWECAAVALLAALPWQDGLVPGQVVEVLSCLELPPCFLPASGISQAWLLVAKATRGGHKKR